MPRPCSRLICTIPFCLQLASTLSASAQDRVDYNRDIRPILSDVCYTCHGPDRNERQAGLRLDTRDGALAALETGHRAIVPGKSSESALFQRIASQNPGERMPPADSQKQLNAHQIELIRKWIDQGAEWKTHWSLIAPVRSGSPQLKDETGVRNPIDRFIREKLETAGLKPSPEASKETLIRRVTFDLTGLPPTLKEVDQFLADESPDAYEKLVDRLLESPRYGEHMTRHWLDVARYGDTHGLHLDNERSMWPYRDWLIGAFNRNIRFDQFTLWQLAGDLLPEPTLEQKVATGFNRCNVSTSEGGSIAEEYRVRYAVDRVETTATVFLGLTAGCAVCHDHKYDPISQKEFYQLFAYFGNVADPAMDGNQLLTPPVIRLPSGEQAQQLEEQRKSLADYSARIEAELKKFKYTDTAADGSVIAPQPREIVWFDDELPKDAKPGGDEAAASWNWIRAPKDPVFSGAKASLRKAAGLSQHFFTGATPGLTISSGDRLFAYAWIDILDPPKTLMLQFNDGSWEHRAYWGENAIQWGTDNSSSRFRAGELPEPGRWVRLEVAAADVGLKAGSTLNGWAFTQYGGTVYWDRAGVVTTSQVDFAAESLTAWADTVDAKSLPAPIQAILKTAAEKRNAAQQSELQNYYVANVFAGSRDVFEPLLQKQRSSERQIRLLEDKIPATLIMADLAAPRETFVLKRGEYDKPDKDQKVEPGVLSALHPLPEQAAANRLGLAQWLIDPANPLTARVTVNRDWQRYFGTGLVKTSEDFGSQGEWPSHPELLDWLALEFIDSGWDVKRMQRLMVTSATYRQSARVLPAHLAKDPGNRLLARGPRFRLDAESLRDLALAVSGLMAGDIGGPSVKPYQPPGIWEAVGYTDSNTARFTQDHGAALYRRSMYTFWKRTAPPASMATFDAPSRESCTVRRSRTNTPLQALVLMNDIQFVEAARAFAERIIKEGGQTSDERIQFAFRLVASRAPDAREQELFRAFYERNLARYQADQAAATKLISTGESPRDNKLDAAEHAAWTIFANLLFNLDETVTKG